VRAPYLVCGVAGPALDDGERLVLENLQPAGLILFARNVRSAGQVAELVAALRAFPWRPYIAVDLEGGSVNRLRPILGELPSPARAAAAGAAAVRALGEAIGAACAALGIGAVFAPVVDAGRGEGFVTLEQRCLGGDPDEVVRMATAYLAGIESYGVAACLKHYPGLGSGRVDSHHELPVLDEIVSEDRKAFIELAAPGRAVMVAHALAPALGEASRPASLSETVVAPLREAECGPIIADDLEMGALARYGSIAERATAALLAGCDQVLVCNALEAREAVVIQVESSSALLAAKGQVTARPRAASSTYGQGRLRAVEWAAAEELAARSREFGGGPK
jgi:beta-N-acetylhexosaminidase